MISVPVLAIVAGLVTFWVAYRLTKPQQVHYASRDFLTAEGIDDETRQVISRSAIHQLAYPLFKFIESRNPLSEGRAEYIEQRLRLAGDYDGTVEDVQIAQIVNAIIYPTVFAVVAYFLEAPYQTYALVGGFLAGFYMYSQPIRILKAKEKDHQTNILNDFTRMVTIYLMQSAGNKTTYDALIDTIAKTKDKTPAIRPQIQQLEQDLFSRTPEDALKRFSSTLDKPYVDRFTNNLLLMLQQADDTNTELNMRLRETLNELQNELTEQKISEMKAKARVPTYISVLAIAVYMIVLLGVTLIFIF